MTAVVLAIAACAAPHSVISTDASGLRTFSIVTVDDAPVVCTMPYYPDAVTGTLNGQVGEQEPVWLDDSAGHRLSVVWPAGFTVKFEPAAAIYADDGRLVARQGEGLRLDQTRVGDASGTFDDPYIASGAVFNGCYPFVR